MRLKQNHELSDELALVERCRRNDTEAFGRIVDAYQNRLYGFIRRMVHDEEDAADMTQEVFIRAFQSMSRFDGRSSMRTWLFKIAHNLCIDRARKNDRGLKHARIDANEEEDGLEMALPDSRWDPEALIIDQEFISLVEQSILDMSEKLRSVLLLHDREDMPYEEIAQTLEIPIGTVKSRLFLARECIQNRIRAYLGQEAKAYE